MGTDEEAIFEAGTLATTDEVEMGAAETTVVACVVSATDELSRTSFTTLVVISAT